MLLLCKGGVAHSSLWRETLGFKDAQRVEPPSSAYRRLPLRLSPHRRHRDAPLQHGASRGMLAKRSGCTAC
ncbi:hypothetical protein NDU88_005539 [Pleurodeles waltl]|uniref:Uncharacterized protein n=1 Tax=Pleurodeles waltl TaxID=8319 RepID=A0AAV7WZ07_PLEWA|nr:hypothetical protein NDU88_005539 [Pleurodeles waltl]